MDYIRELQLELLLFIKWESCNNFLILCNPIAWGREYLYISLKTISMPLITVVIVLVVAGVLLWVINAYIPMDGKIKKILNVVVVIAVAIWLLKVFGLFAYLTDIRV